MALSAAQIRSGFVRFFEKRGHAFVPSAPVVPAEDPTLLFTNAGMNQFKGLFLGTEKRGYTRAANAQKCIRVSGKHNDLEAVGRDTYHHTFFEMLGNWSFGDYFKEEAISWAHELLVSEWKLDPKRLWYTVYRDDDEAAAIWRKVAGVPSERVRRFGEAENFWEMGECGPCGPCTEIHYDRGAEACDRKGEAGHACAVNGGCARYIEIWNLVFIQFDRAKDGKLSPLPARHVDTGMGLERIAAILQGKGSNYDTDLFMPIIEECVRICAKGTTGLRYAGPAAVPLRVVADHIRALTFAISDGVVPSNDGRGYVLRKILRRAAVYGLKLQPTNPFLNELVPTVISLMEDAYPELKQKAEVVRDAIRREEELFHRTLQRNLEIFREMFTKANAGPGKPFPGEQAWILYDRYGLTLDLTQILCRDEGADVDVTGFGQGMGRQRDRSKEAAGELRMEIGVAASIALPPNAETRFEGYGSLETASRRLAVLPTAGLFGAPKEATVALLLDPTPFYAEAGGQVGDRGTIEGDAASGRVRLEILDTQRIEGRIVSFARAAEGNPADLPETVLARVDRGCRRAIAKNHTATHLLHHGLRTRLGAHVQQAGSLVAPERLRFDFNHPSQVKRDDLEAVETLVNDKVLEDLPVETRETTLKEALDSGAIAFFGEKYGERVRVVDIGGFSVELCGGTHVTRTGEIGLFKVVGESAVSAGVRRIEAISGTVSVRSVQAWERSLHEIAERISTPREQAAERVAQLLEEMKGLRKEIERGRLKDLASEALDIASKAEPLGPASKFAGAVLPGASADDIRIAADGIRKRIGSGVVFLGSEKEGKVSLVCMASEDLAKAGFDAVALIRAAAREVSGGGGGKPDMAQAGGKNPSGLPKAIEVGRAFARSKVGTPA